MAILDIYNGMRFYEIYDNEFSRDDGFAFTSIDNPLKNDAIIIRCPFDCDCWSPRLVYSTRTLEEHIRYINKNKITKAIIIADDIRFITQCPSLTHIQIFPADTAPQNFDYSPLYDMPEIKFFICETVYGNGQGPKKTIIDYSKINGLVKLPCINGEGNLNYEKCATLEEVRVNHDRRLKDLSGFLPNNRIARLDLYRSRINSLKGLSNFHKIKKLCIDSVRLIDDISFLADVSKTLTVLSIENCPKIKDFSVLHKLENLQHLYLKGNNNLSDLSFLNDMKNLKAFTFSMNILDDDLTPCMNVPYINSIKHKKTYNIRKKDLPNQLPEHDQSKQSGDGSMID